MKILITINFLVGLLLMATMIATKKFEDSISLLIGMALLPTFWILALANIVAAFCFWKKHHLRAFLPLISYALVVMLIPGVTRFGSRIVLSGTPCYPESFLTDKTKSELENIANQLLGHSFKKIFTFPSKTNEIEMISGCSQKELPAGVSDKLRAFGFQRTDIDDSQALVVFCHYKSRRWYEYLFTTNPLPTLYARSVSFTDVDIGDWSELLRIAKQGNSATDAEKRRIVFSPSIVYPYLQQTLGDNLLSHFRSYTSADQITAEQKALVLRAINRQRETSSRLVEYPQITFVDNKRELHMGERWITDDSFWVSSLIKQLLDKGVLVHADDGRHLKIKSYLSPEETANIEWVHVGIMNFLYGNLVDKRAYAYDQVLGNGWYYKRR